MSYLPLVRFILTDRDMEEPDYWDWEDDDLEEEDYEEDGEE